MTFAVRDIFQADRIPPSDRTTPNSVSPLLDYLVSRLIDSLSGGMADKFVNLSSPLVSDHDTTLLHGRAWAMIKDEWPKAKGDLDSGKPSPLGLIKHRSLNPIDILNDHQVLAWGYDLNGDDLVLHLYDPNHPDEDVTLALNISMPQHTTPITYTSASGGDGHIFMFFRINYSFVDPASIAPRRPTNPFPGLPVTLCRA
jgi:hypothetical protein